MTGVRFFQRLDFKYLRETYTKSDKFFIEEEVVELQLDAEERGFFSLSKTEEVMRLDLDISAKMICIVRSGRVTRPRSVQKIRQKRNERIMGY